MDVREFINRPTAYIDVTFVVVDLGVVRVRFIDKATGDYIEVDFSSESGRVTESGQLNWLKNLDAPES